MGRLHKLGHGLVPWSRTADPGLVQHQHKEVNALTVDNAGIAQFQTSLMQNINVRLQALPLARLWRPAGRSAFKKYIRSSKTNTRDQTLVTDP